MTPNQGSPSLATHNAWDIPLANFTVYSGDNHIHRPKGGSSAETGALKSGKVTQTNLTLNTETGEWEVKGFDKMYLDYSITIDLRDIFKGVISDEVLDQLDEAGILDLLEEFISDIADSIAPGSGGSAGGGGIDFGLIEGVFGDLIDKISAGKEVTFKEIKEAIEGLLPS